MAGEPEDASSLEPHSSADDVVGYVDPATMHETDEGLVVRGQLDLEDSEVAREAWWPMKHNAIGSPSAS